VYDVVASMWRIVITLFFREIRSRGAWKIPRAAEGPVIFVVGPHHNQVRSILSTLRQFKERHELMFCIATVPRPAAPDERGQARERSAHQLPHGGQEHGQGVRRARFEAHAEQCVLLSPLAHLPGAGCSS